MSQKWVFIILSLLLPSLNAEPLRLTVEEAVQVAVTNHLQLKAAQLSIAEARARLHDSGRLPNPEVETEFAPNINGREYGFRVGFNQRFPLTSRLAREKKISKLAVQLAEAEVRDFRRRVAFDARVAAVKLAAMQESIRLHQAQLENLRATMNTYQQSAKVGEASPVEIVQLELSTDQIIIAQAQLEAESSEARRNLALLLGPENFLVEIGDVLSSPQPIENKSIEIDPSVYALSGLRIASAQEAIGLAKAKQWEDAGFGLFTGIDRDDDEPTGLNTDHNVGFRFFIPIPLWNKREGAVAEARIKAEQAKLEAEAIKRQTISESTAAQDQLRSAANRWRLINGELLAKSRVVETQFQTFQREGQIPFSEVIRAKERTLQLQAAEIAARRDFHLARARQIWAAGHTQEGTK